MAAHYFAYRIQVRLNGQASNANLIQNISKFVEQDLLPGVLTVDNLCSPSSVLPLIFGIPSLHYFASLPLLPRVHVDDRVNRVIKVLGLQTGAE